MALEQNPADAFEARELLLSRYSGDVGESDKRGLMPFYLKCFHDFYKSELCSKLVARGPMKLLEFGGGPTIHTLVSASPNVAEITFADYADSCLKEIELWRNGHPTSHDWSACFKYVVGTLERNEDDDAPYQREEELRGKIREVIPCDILSDKVLGQGTTERAYDILSTSLCAEAACGSVTEYAAAIKKLVALMKPGGVLLCVVALGGTWYSVQPGAKRHVALKLTSEDVHRVWQEAGITIVVTKVHEIPKNIQNTLGDSAALMFLVGQIS